MLLGKVLRGLVVTYYRARMKRSGQGLRIGLGARMPSAQNMTVGDDVYIGPGVYVSSPAEVIIGHRVMFGPDVMIIGGDHDLSNTEVPLRFAPAPPPPAPIVIEDDSWIGARVLILKSVRIGRDAVIGAGSVVTRDVPAGAIAAGNPCRVLRQRSAMYRARRRNGDT